MLNAPSKTYYSFLLWFNIETKGSTHCGYITTPNDSTTKAYFPNTDTVLNITASALYIKSKYK
jgi:hypothetical protein